MEGLFDLSLGCLAIVPGRYLRPRSRLEPPVAVKEVFNLKLQVLGDLVDVLPLDAADRCREDLGIGPSITRRSRDTTTGDRERSARQ
jgi:hypothetical protein